MREGEELVLEPFQPPHRRRSADGLSSTTGFWRSMDTLRDRQVLEDLVEQGEMPWRKREERGIEA